MWRFTNHPTIRPTTAYKPSNYWANPACKPSNYWANHCQQTITPLANHIQQNHRTFGTMLDPSLSAASTWSGLGHWYSTPVRLSRMMLRFLSHNDDDFQANFLAPKFDFPTHAAASNQSFWRKIIQHTWWLLFKLFGSKLLHKCGKYGGF